MTSSQPEIAEESARILELALDERRTSVVLGVKMRMHDDVSRDSCYSRQSVGSACWLGPNSEGRCYARYWREIACRGNKASPTAGHDIASVGD